MCKEDRLAYTLYATFAALVLTLALSGCSIAHAETWQEWTQRKQTEARETKEQKHDRLCTTMRWNAAGDESYLNLVWKIYGASSPTIGAAKDFLSSLDAYADANCWTDTDRWFGVRESLREFLELLDKGL